MVTPDATKPLVVIGCTPMYGHMYPIRAVAKDLVSRGYEVTFVSCSHYRPIFEEVGCTYVNLEGYADWYDAEIGTTRFVERNSLPPGPVQVAYDFENLFMRPIPEQHHAMQKAIKMLTKKYPGRPIVQVNEAVFHGGLPITQGARGIKPTATLGLGVIPMVLSSIDTAPYGPAILPDSSPEGRERNKTMQQQVLELFFGKPMETYCEVFEELGAHAPPKTCVDAPYLFVDRFLQMCIPSAEYIRSDMPDSIRFIGGLPWGSKDSMVNPPAWWKEVSDNVEKDIVFVCQGTVATLNYNDLIIPTLEALKNRPNTLVIVAVGKRGESLPEGTPIPDNARIADFLPFDDVLPHCHVFVTNGGYGAFQHSICNGVPLLVAGSGEDKPESCARAEWCGIAVNLRTGKPTKEAILEGVEVLIREPKYKKRAMELKAEMDGYDPMSIVAQNIDELAAGKHLK